MSDEEDKPSFHIPAGSLIQPAQGMKLKAFVVSTAGTATTVQIEHGYTLLLVDAFADMHYGGFWLECLDVEGRKLLVRLPGGIDGSLALNIGNLSRLEWEKSWAARERQHSVVHLT